MADMDAFVHVKGCGVSSVEYQIHLVGVNSYSLSNCCCNGVLRLHTMWPLWGRSLLRVFQ